jgi:malate dehydrogenase (oxaloacetate-decarboxylating)
MASKLKSMFLILTLFFQLTLEIDYGAESLRIHANKKGKISVISKVSVDDKDELSIAYTPGVAEPCKKIAEDKTKAYRYTIKGHTVATVTDGTAVLGLGDIGPEAALPVMEAKSIIFKEFGKVDSFPICLDTKDPEEIIKTVKYISPTFGGINLEDISAPRCFEIEEKLMELDIPVFHTDQHGAAITVIAGLINALKIVKKNWKDLKIVVAGSGAAGLSTCRLLMNFNPDDIILTNRKGIVYEGRPGLNPYVSKMAKITNKNKMEGTLADALVGADVLIGFASANIVTSEMIESMNEDAIVFALSNPIPEIMPEEAFKGGARIVATARPDFPNQLNNILVYPGIFRGALMVRAKSIVDDMKIGAARALASLVSDRELNEKYILPEVYDKRVAKVIAEEVASVAESLGIAQNPGNRDW